MAGISADGATIRNSIFWENYDDTGFTELAQFRGSSSAIFNVSHSIVHGWTGSWGGVGNSGVDPLFVDADEADDIAGTEDDDLRLRPGSPAINAGDPDTSYLPATDLDGHARVLCGRADMGAYEFGIGDYDCNQTVDLADFANWQSCATGPSTADTAVAHGTADTAVAHSSSSPTALRVAVGDASGTTLPPWSLRRGDATSCVAFDFDGDVDLTDFAALQDGFDGP